jgi:hypothetical protein
VLQVHIQPDIFSTMACLEETMLQTWVAAFGHSPAADVRAARTLAVLHEQETWARSSLWDVNCSTFQAYLRARRTAAGPRGQPRDWTGARGSAHDSFALKFHSLRYLTEVPPRLCGSARATECARPMHSSDVRATWQRLRQIPSRNTMEKRLPHGGVLVRDMLMTCGFEDNGYSD